MPNFRTWPIAAFQDPSSYVRSVVSDSFEGAWAKRQGYGLILSRYRRGSWVEGETSTIMPTILINGGAKG